MKRLLAVLNSVVLTTSIAFAQDAVTSESAVFDFEVTEYNLGKIKEEDGLKKAVFIFKNIGDKPLKIDEVTAGCGCTTPEWSDKEVLPGDTGSISASYNPAGRPGTFYKSLIVKANTKPDTRTLIIRGEVIPRKDRPDTYYPSRIGNLQFTTTHFGFNKVYTNEKPTVSIQLKNSGNRTIKVLGFSEGDPSVSFKMEPEEIPAGEKATLTATFDVKEIYDFGLVLLSFKMKTTDLIDSDKDLYVSANVYEHFPEMTAEELAQAPKVRFDRKEYNFGVIKDGESVKTSFKVYNDGKSSLIIRKVQPSCSCTVPELDKKLLRPGEETTIHITYTTNEKFGRQKKSIAVITNDPQTPQTYINIKATVEE